MTATQHDVLDLLDAICDGYDYDPGSSDLDDEQPIVVHITLGEYRKAQLLKYLIEEAA